MSGNWVLMDGSGDENTSGLYLYNYHTDELRHLTNFTTGVGVGMWNDTVAWVRQGSTIPDAPYGYAQIIVYNVTTNTSRVAHEVTERGASGADPYQDSVVYEKGNLTTHLLDIWAFNTKDGADRPIAVSENGTAATHQIPRMSGDWVVYEDDPLHSFDGVSAYNILAGGRVSLSERGDRPDVWQNRVVWHQFAPDGGSNTGNIALECLPEAPS
jgi:hypothetical protein